MKFIDNDGNIIPGYASYYIDIQNCAWCGRPGMNLVYSSTIVFCCLEHFYKTKEKHPEWFESRSIAKWKTEILVNDELKEVDKTITEYQNAVLSGKVSRKLKSKIKKIFRWIK